jgi:KDO2-lipid IV(A) lauroyltransferase
MENKKFRENLLFYIVLGFCRFIAWFPFWLLYFLSDGLFLLTYYVVGYRRKVVRDNLQQCFPQKSIQEIVRLEKGFYHYFCDYIVETIKMTSASVKTMQKHMQFKGVEEMEKHLLDEECNFVFIYLGHYCNWEWMASLPNAVNSEILIAQIYHPLYNKAMDRFFLRLRGRFGGECVSMKNTLRRVIQLNKEKRPTIVGFISDQLPKFESMYLFMPFLNHPETPVFTGGEQMGKRLNVKYYYADIKRPRRGYYECTFVPMENEDTEGQTEYPMTERFMQMLEDTIRRAPQYWLWTHKRWKRTKEQWMEWKAKHSKKS